MRVREDAPEKAERHRRRQRGKRLSGGDSTHLEWPSLDKYLTRQRKFDNIHGKKGFCPLAHPSYPTILRISLTVSSFRVWIWPSGWPGGDHVPRRRSHRAPRAAQCSRRVASAHRRRHELRSLSAERLLSLVNTTTRSDWPE